MKLRKLALLLLLVSVAGEGIVFSQNTGKTVRKSREVVSDPINTTEVARAEAAMQTKDFAAAEKDLNSAVEKNPKNFRAWFDLGFVYNATDRSPQAIDAYRKSVEANPQIFESTLNLGILLARSGNIVEAEKYLRDATKLKPTDRAEEGWSRAWLSLGEVLRTTKPAEAVEAFRNAGNFLPKDAYPHLSAGLLLEQQKEFAEAALEYQKAAELDPKSSEALAGLVNAYTAQKQYPEAETALRKYIALDPANPVAHVQFGRVLVAQEKWDEAASELELGLKSRPGDPVALKELANIYLVQKRFDDALPHLNAALQAAPNDAELHHSMGLVYMNQRKFPEAQKELMTALKLKPNLAGAYGDLALVASENKDYQLTLKALSARAKLIPDSPGTYFLRATAFDHLRDFEHAAENYRQFLVVAEGRYPDEEWKAKHRLIAIEPEGSKSKKK
jgi:tetratricopeptide (TPR) repeat protein